MAYEYITKYNSPNFGYGVSGTHGQNHPLKIVIHYWGKEGQVFENVVNWLCRENGDSSAHYVLQANKIACLIDPNDAAYHCGNAYWNQHSIGIECRPEMTDGDIETLCELIAELWHVYGKLEIVGHKDIVDTSCPGKYYKKIPYIKKRAEEIFNSKKAKPKDKDYRIAIAEYITDEKNTRYMNVYKDELEDLNVQGYTTTLMTVKTNGERTVWTEYDKKKKKITGKKMGYTKKKGTKMLVRVVHKFK